MYIIKCALQHFVGDFARLLFMAQFTILFYVTSRINRCPQNRMNDQCQTTTPGTSYKLMVKGFPQFFDKKYLKVNQQFP